MCVVVRKFICTCVCTQEQEERKQKRRRINIAAANKISLSTWLCLGLIWKSNTTTTLDIIVKLTEIKTVGDLIRNKALKGLLGYFYII